MKKCGFTLVELLAVIIVLAVLTLITTPIVIGTIQNAKKDTFVSSAKNTIDAAVHYDAKGESISKDGIRVGDLDLKEKELYEGLIFVNSEGTFVLKNFTNGDFCASGTKDNLLVVKGDCKNTSLEPTVTSFVVTGKTTKSVSVKVEASDDTGIMEYQYCIGSCRKEEEWIISKETSYTFENLKHSTEYNVYVRVFNRIEKMTEKSIQVTTNNLPLPTYAVSPSGWATSKTVKVTYPAGYQYSYMVLEGTVKESGVVVPVGQRRTVSGTSVTLTFESNGRMKAVTSDGYNDATAADLIVSQIDTTAPTGVSIAKGTVSSKSIQVTANGVDNESGITKYEFSKDNGKTWITNSSKTYTFTNLTSGTYQIKVRLTNQVGLSSEASLSVTTLSIATPTYAVTPSGWATSKTATIHVTSGYTNQFKVTSGTATYNGTAVTNNTWITISGTSAQVVFTSNGALTTQVSDGINTVAGSNLSINQIDTTAPTGVSVGKGTVTSKSIQVTANGVDNESGITKYEFSKDNGATWMTNSTATYTFTNLTTGTYAIKVRLTNGSGLTSEASLSIATTTLTAPTYSTNTSGWTISKTVTVTYPTGYTNQVKVTSGTATYNGTTLPLNTWYTVSGNAQIVFKSNGTMVAQVTDGVNAKSGSSLTINQIDTTAPVVNSLSIASTTTVYNALTTTITSNVTDNSGATIQMYISNSGYETGGSWQTYGTSKSWNVEGSLNGSSRTIYITFKDQAGNKVNRTLSYTVYKDCSNTTTTWGEWSDCSVSCGGGIKTRTGNKYDDKTGNHCGTVSGQDSCNNQSCEPKIQLISKSYRFAKLIPVNSTTVIGLITGTDSSASDSTMNSYLDAVVIKVDANGNVTFGTQTRLGSGSVGMGKNVTGVRLTDQRVLIAANSKQENNGYDKMATLAIVEINGTTPTVISRQTIGDSSYSKTVESLACTSATSCKFSVLRARSNTSSGGCSASSYHYNVTISGNNINLSQLDGNYSYFTSDLESKTGILHTITDCNLTSRYSNSNTAYLSSGEYVDIINLGWGTGPTKGYELSVYKNGQTIFNGSKTGTDTTDVQTASVVRMHDNQFLVMNKSDQLLFYNRSGSTWVAGKTLKNEDVYPSNLLVPIGDYHALLYSTFNSKGIGGSGPQPLYLITGY